MSKVIQNPAVDYYVALGAMDAARPEKRSTLRDGIIRDYYPITPDDRAKRKLYAVRNPYQGVKSEDREGALAEKTWKRRQFAKSRHRTYRAARRPGDWFVPKNPWTKQQRLRREMALRRFKNPASCGFSIENA